MNTDIARQKLFSTLVDQAIITSRQLISMLESEFEALSANSPDLLDTIVEEKKQYLLKLSQIMAEQNSLLSSVELTCDAKGVETLYANLPETHSAKKNWNTLQTLAKVMAENNLRNGIMLSQHTENTRNALNILTGGNNDKPTYQYGGKTQAYRQNNSLAYA